MPPNRLTRRRLVLAALAAGASAAIGEVHAVSTCLPALPAGESALAAPDEAVGRAFGPVLDAAQDDERWPRTLGGVRVELPALLARTGQRSGAGPEDVAAVVASFDRLVEARLPGTDAAWYLPWYRAIARLVDRGEWPATDAGSAHPS
jgi:hypothetical protein